MRLNKADEKHASESHGATPRPARVPEIGAARRTQPTSLALTAWRAARVDWAVMRPGVVRRRPSGGRKWLVLLALTPGVFLALADATIMTIALPSMIRVGFLGHGRLLVLNGYNLVLRRSLTMGRLGTAAGTLVYPGGLALFAIASAGCALSLRPLGDLFRVFQATGAAAVVPMSLTILLAAFPGSQQGLAAGLFGALGTLAASVGPALGGALITYGSWH